MSQLADHLDFKIPSNQEFVSLSKPSPKPARTTLSFHWCFTPFHFDPIQTVIKGPPEPLKLSGNPNGDIALLSPAFQPQRDRFPVLRTISGIRRLLRLINCYDLLLLIDQLFDEDIPCCRSSGSRLTDSLFEFIAPPLADSIPPGSQPCRGADIALIVTRSYRRCRFDRQLPPPRTKPHGSGLYHAHGVFEDPPHTSRCISDCFQIFR